MAFDRSVQLDRFYACLRDIEPDLTLSLLAVLFAIERSPGLSVNDLAEAVDIPQQTASRYISVLQGRYQPIGSSENFFAKEPLVEITISPDDPRRRALKLTSKGRARIDGLLKAMFKGLSDV
jgi:DNA-binding MarR family transcriptional regulator